MSEPSLVEAFDFVIVNAELHEKFDAFKKAEVQPRFSYVYWFLSFANAPILHLHV